MDYRSFDHRHISLSEELSFDQIKSKLATIKRVSGLSVAALPVFAGLMTENPLEAGDVLGSAQGLGGIVA